MSWLSRERWPEHLTTFRLLLGPVLLASSFFGEHPRFFLFALVAGLLSDIFDGILARRLGVATDALRAYDSRVDLIFWLCVLATTWVVRPTEVAEHAGPIAAVVGAEGASHATSLLRFGRMASAHALLSKAYAVSLFTGLAALLCFGLTGGWLATAVNLGIAANIDCVLILLLLPSWQRDIPSCWHAWRLRRGLPIRRNSLFHG